MFQRVGFGGVEQEARCFLDQLGHVPECGKDGGAAEREGEDGRSGRQDVDEREDGHIRGIQVKLKILRFEVGRRDRGDVWCGFCERDVVAGVLGVEAKFFHHQE